MKVKVMERTDLEMVDKHPDLMASYADECNAINEALAEVNGRTTTHCYTSYRDIINICREVEKRLDKSGIPQKNRSGITVNATSGVPTAKAYGRAHGKKAIATYVELIRGSTAWFLVRVQRMDRWTGPGGDEKINIRLHAAACDAVLRHALSPFDYNREDLPAYASREAAAD